MKKSREAGGRWGLDVRLLGALACAAALAGSGAQAQTVPTGFQEYFVVGFEQHVWDMMEFVGVSEGAGGFANGTNSVISAVASADNQIIRYDHWEDGFEADIQAPVQPTTLVIGDGNLANGRACDFTADPRIAPCDGTNDDTIFQGTAITFNSDQGLGCAPPPNDISCSVPINPRNPADIRYDGGDFLVTSGGPLAVVHPQDPLSPFIGGATELISRQALANATSYSIPVGEDIYLGDNTVTEPFKYVHLNLVAFEDNTQVVIDSPGAGTVVVTLNKGQHYSTQGNVDSTPAPAITINAGTKVSTTGPIAGLIFTGGDGTYSTRFYTLLPDLLHSTDYMITAPGDDPVPQGSRPLNLYFLNPDPLNPLTVTTTDNIGTSAIVIPANSQVDYFTGTGRFVPANSTVRFTSNRNFWGVSAYSHQSAANDWGHSWLASRFLTDTYTSAFAPGVNNPAFQSQPAQRLANDPACTIPPAGPGVCDPLNRSPLFVSATLDNTRVQVDFDNDGVFDVIDLDGDDFPDPAPLPNNTYVVNALQSLRVYDHTDYDNTGTRIVANKEVAVAYGQDTDQATGPDPIQDTGYAIYPISQLFLDPVLVVEKEVDVTTVPTAGGVATYTVSISSFDFGPMTNLLAYDLLPPGVAGADYVPGSTLVTYPNLSQDTTDPTASIDPTTGRDRLDWTLSPDTISTNQSITIRYSVNIPAAPGGTPRLLTNEAHAEGTLGGSTFSPFDTADVVQTDIVLTKSVDITGPAAGQTITFTLNVSNTGALAETGVTVSDAIPPDTTYVPGSVTSSAPFAGSFSAAQNAVVWTAANFPPGGPHALTFQVTVNPAVPSGTEISNRGGYESNETPFFLSNEAVPVVAGPALTSTKSATPGSVLHPNELVTFEIVVENTGVAAATNVLIRDPFPGNAGYVAGTMTWRLNAGAFASVTDAADADEGTAFVDRLELLVASLGPGEDVTFRFQATVDPGTAGQFVSNQANVSADNALATDTNVVVIPVVGDNVVTGHVFQDDDGDGIPEPTDGNGVQDAGEPDLANIDVLVTDSTGVTQTVTTDASGDYAATVDVACYADNFAATAYDGSDGSLDWSGAGDEWTETGASADQDPTTIQLLVEADPLGVFGNSLLIEGGPVAATRGFDRRADLSAGAGFTAGFAALSFDFRRVSMEAADFVDLLVDYGAGFGPVQNFPGIGTDATWQSFSVALASAQLPANPVFFRLQGTNFNFANDNFYVDNVRVCNTQVTADVDETDPDLPAGASLTTANDPQTAELALGGTAPTGDVGYELPFAGALTFTKTSDAGGTVIPGQTVNYTLSFQNTGTLPLTVNSITDPPPVGTSAAGAAQVNVLSDSLRVTEYYLGPGTFAGTLYDLTLNQALAADYFVIAQGSDGDGTTGGNRGPDENYVSLTQDPLGTGGLGVSAGATTLRFERGNAVDSWVGVVTVVECVANCATDGFSLLDVERVAHVGAAASGAVTTTAWAAINQVMLMGGFNGAGCDTADPDVADTKVCHVRLFPSATDQINWTRDAGGGATLSTATSTVMVVDWGSAWTVQRRQILGTNGGDGANVVGEYDTAAISSVARANTWVWGTGHTADNGIGDAAEGVLLALGDGVNQNANETLLAAGGEYNDAKDFEVYALTHAQLATDHQFKADGDTAAITLDLAVPSATADRMALVYNGQNGTGTAYPRPMFSARYLTDTSVRLERRRSGQAWPAWVQGADFSGVATLNNGPGGTPGLGDLLGGFAPVVLQAGDSIVVTFSLVVDDPLAGGITDVTNVATAATSLGNAVAQVVDLVARPSVDVEPNDADFGPAGSTVTYTHFVTNDGDVADSYEITATSETGWTLELIDPGTGSVIATDTDGDGVWDGATTVSTGTLQPGASIEYRLRVSIPGGAGLGDQDTEQLHASSESFGNTISSAATDETSVLDGASFGPIALVPDNSGVVTVGGSIAYTHRVFNNTGATDTFDLLASTSGAGWTATIYWDTNDDGEYTPGIDVAIVNTAQLIDGASQLIFVVVDAPGGASLGDVDITTLTAISRNDTALFDAASDTTTVVATPLELDLAGGGTQLTDEGLTPVFPGTVKNLTAASDRFDFSISASSLNGVDALNHPTELWVDTNADGVPDTEIAEDTDGDGSWDTIAPGFDTDTDNLPDAAVPANDELAYELRRTVPVGQVIRKEYATLTTTSQASGESDSITATSLLAVATRVTIVGVRVYPSGVVEFATGMQRGTSRFHLYQTGDAGASSGRTLISREPVRSPRANSNLPTLYRVETEPITQPYVIIEEIERDGDRNMMGPFPIADAVLAAGYAELEARFDELDVRAGDVRSLRGGHLKRAERDEKKLERKERHRKVRKARRERGAEGVKLSVDAAGIVEVPIAELEAAGLPSGRKHLRVSNLGRKVPASYVRHGVQGPALRFVAEAFASDATRSNVYVISRKRPQLRVELTTSSVPLTPGALRVEKSTQYLASIPLEQDPWVWDFMLGDGNTWPYFWSLPGTGDFDVAGLVAGASGPVSVDVSVIAFTEHDHSLTAFINGAEIGRLEFSGPVRGTLRGSVPAEALLAAGNRLTIRYGATNPQTGLPDPSAVLLLDYLELHTPESVVPLGSVAPSEIAPFDSRLPGLKRVDYLIVTHPLFREQADRLAGLKELDGLHPVVIETEQAYDRFSAGVPEPNAIRALIRYVAARSRQLRFVVLIGDDTFDPSDNLGTGAASFVPSINAWDGEFGRVPSEHPYSDLDDDGLPDVAIGRIPVQTLAQATAVIDKIELQADVVAAGLANHVFAVDNHSEADVPFRDEAENVAALLAPGSSVQWSDIDAGIAAARSNLRTGWQTAGMVHYFGHGGPALWADENLLSTSTVGDLDGASQPALVFTWGCQAQWHQYLFSPSVNEALLLLPGGGATASFGPAGITAPVSQQPLYQRFYAHLFHGEASTLGEVILDAKRQALVEAPESRFAVEGFLLFGDPALPLPRE